MERDALFPGTPFLGRDALLATAMALLSDPTVRLLTLHGVAGVGKTRVALQLHAFLSERADRPVVFVRGASLQPAGLANAILQSIFAIDPDVVAGASSVHDAISERPFLLFIDNVEHLLPVTVVSEIVHHCRNAQLVLTSQIITGVSGEVTLRVPPLPVGSAAADDDTAVRLFCERARRHDPTWTPTPADVTAIATICEQVDGLPLAIELAAARMRHLTPAMIADHLESSLDVLARGPVDAPDRHRSVDEMIRWSYNLLSDDEQRIFRRLSVFAGQIDLQAVRSMGPVSDDDPPWSDSDAIAMLASLGDRSLLVSLQRWWGMEWFQLRVVRDVARRYLDESGEYDAIALRHARHFARRVPMFEQRFAGIERSLVMDVILSNRPNVRAAMTTFARLGLWDELVDLAIALEPIWHFGRTGSDYGEWVGPLLTAERLASYTPDRRTQVRVLAGRVALANGNLPDVRRHAEAAVVAASAPETSDLARGRAHRILADVQFHEGDVAAASETLRRIAPVIVRDGNPIECGHLMYSRAVCEVNRAHPQRGGVFARAAEVAYTQAGSQRNVAHVAFLTVESALWAPDPQRAIDTFDRTRDTLGRFLSADEFARVRIRVVDALIAVGERNRALGLLVTVLDEMNEEQNDDLVALWEVVANHWCLTESSSHDAAGLSTGAALVSGVHRFPPRLPAPRAQELRETIRRACERSQGDSEPTLGLTGRERDVLRLLAMRLSDREIADRLFISTRTVGHHTRSVFRKIGVANRRAAAVWWSTNVRHEEPSE